MYELELTKGNRIKVSKIFSTFKKVDLSIDCVIEGQFGKVYVDVIENPKIYFLKNGPFYFLAGDSESDDAIHMIEKIERDSMIMQASKDWINKVKKVFKNDLIIWPRFNFSSETLSINKIQENINLSRIKGKVNRIDLDKAREIYYDKKYFFHLTAFDSPEDFINRGIGYYYEEEEKNNIVGVISSALVCSKGIEINIMVLPDYREKGIGKTLASYLIKYCLENNIDPHWSAANPISFKLAESLGYKHIETYIAYFIKST